MKNSIVFLFAFCVLPVHAAIYKWTDEQGNTHFGDCLPEKCGSKPVELEPLVILQSDPLPELPEWKSGAMLEKEQFERSADEKTDFGDIPSFGLNPPLKHYQCHKTPESMNDPDWSLVRESVEAAPLNTREAIEVAQFLRKMKGSWRGDMSEKVFIRRDGEQVVLERNYYASMYVDRFPNGQVYFDMELGPHKNYDERTGLSDLQYWITLDDKGVLRSGRDRNFREDSIFKKMWNNQFVEWNGGKLEIIRNSRAAGRGGVSRLSYRFFERKDNHNMLMTECFYTQGYIESVRTWKLRNS